MIVQQGSINTTALVTPDLYVQIVPPSVYLLNGVPTNIAGLVGTAQWGPVNSPTIVGNLADFTRQFGNIQNRKYDVGTALAAAVLQGGSGAYYVVRVTDGTDVAATIAVLTNCITFTSKWTGTLGNSCQVTIATGSAANSYKVMVAQPGQQPEVFDNITGTGNALWVNMAAAITNGQNALRGPSQIIKATAGAGATAASLATYSLAGGTDGIATITSAVLIGQDTVPRKGMYALRNLAVSVAALVDCDDTTVYTTQVSFGLSEGVYMIATGPAGDTISNAVSAKNTAGIDSYAIKILFGDWCLFNDTVNGVQRLISPQGFVVGLLSNLAPNQSTLNKPMQGIIGTQKTIANQVYSGAELQTLAAAGFDLITNPLPRGPAYGCRFGRNTSSNAVIHGDNYTRMTNYIAATLNAGMGIYVGQLQSADVRRNAKVTLDSFLQGLADQDLIGNADGTTPFQTVLDSTNNLPSRVALGYMQADVKVQYLSVIEYFLVNLEGGQSVSISRTSTTLNNNY
ncbi:hypothetical protein GCM10007036_14440 [Alsobacter metallidurans]|uniref:Phage tail sheath protein n=1 Tax=Alsobacter metallidurans TaxID=340221 RepID=A0A917MHH0_9HYPH|nr:phage tail protein [Alsobacter metallidurans]GGH14859.1 hypothetical protein GCM10007036_14440 [Alsobacter metallidurans]